MKDIKIFPRRKKGKKQQYGREQYKSLPEDEKQKLVDYRKKKKNCLIIIIMMKNHF